MCIVMKKRVTIMIMLFTLMVACTSGKVQFKEVNKVPDKLSQLIDGRDIYDHVQMYNNDEAEHYIVVYSKGVVEGKMSQEDDRIIVDLNEVDADEAGHKQYIFYLKTNDDDHLIDVQLNGQSVSYPVIGADF